MCSKPRMIRSYLPFFAFAEKYPSFRFATHFTGILLEWIEAHHPEHIALLRRMIQSGQLEMISGGYYEPILSVIPASDQRSTGRDALAKDQEFI